MKRKNGFTLIELLAVIVILAIIALIATPMILGIIDSAKKGAAENSAYGYIDAIEKSGLQNMIDIGNYTTKKDGTYDLDSIGVVKYKGTQPTQICIVMKDGSVESGEFQFGSYIVDYKNGKAKVNTEKTQIVCSQTGEGNTEEGTLPTSKIMAEPDKEEGLNFLNSGIERQQIESLKIIKTTEFPNGAIDVSEAQNGSVMLWSEDSNNNTFYEVTIGGIDGVLANEDSEMLFSDFLYAHTLDLTDFYTYGVINMDYMISGTARESVNFTLNLGNHFDTSKVTSMDSLFHDVGKMCNSFSLNLGDKLDTSNVTNMRNMFKNVGRTASNFTLNLGNRFNTSKVTDMRNMFESTGLMSNVFTLNLGNQFNTSNVTAMDYMFSNTGSGNEYFTLDLRTFDFGKVTTYSKMLEGYVFDRLLTVKDQASKDWILNNVAGYLEDIQIAS